MVDEAAHAKGSATDFYTDAIARTDARIGGVLDAARGWTVIVTTDHGQQDLPVGPSPATAARARWSARRS